MKHFRNPERWSISSSVVVLKNKWLTVWKRSYLLPNGKELKDYFVIEKPDVVINVILNDRGQTLLAKEFERGVSEVGYKFPAGYIDFNEEKQLAAQ